MTDFNSPLYLRIRVYLTQCRESDYSLPEAVMTAVTDDFVQLRQNDPNQFTTEDLHSHLILARLGKNKHFERIQTKIINSISNS